MITESEYNELRARYDRKEQWRNGRSSYQTSEIPNDCQISNDEISAIELYEFCANPPQAYFCYVHLGDYPLNKANERYISTWVGERLGTITYVGPIFHLFGNKWNKARSIRVKAINGLTYAGTYYCGAGDYARIKQVKDQ